MSLPILLACTVLGLALLPALMVGWNLFLLRPLPRRRSRSRVSVLIPARDEAENIAAAIESVLASPAADFELLVLDDHSTDATARIVGEIAARDPRLRLLEGRRHDPALWGKPQACAELAAAAGGDCLVFMDADVRLEADAIDRIAGFFEVSPAAMLSGIPRQRTPGLAEKLVVPLIHFVLLGFLPLAAMRSSPRPDFGVACGQLLAVRREAYEAAGGHRRIAHRIHDGMALARRFREAGFATDLADFSDIASCRMYRSTRELVAGFAKNAHEGLGSPAGILPWSLLLVGGQTAWLALLPAAAAGLVPLALVAAAAGISWLTRLALDLRFRQSLLGACLHPLGVLALVGIQWYALARRLAGRPVAWKARLPRALPPAGASLPSRSSATGASPRSARSRRSA